ncbi:hypothetical protein [Yoonia sp. SS1-5]|uniref:Uncharacterized protein n=1 Tax=Yoonia rhodophyticola TaxID=3137370 RepID=A0AAN0MK74_9RHOB
MAADLEQGIVLTQPDGRQETFRAQGNGIVEAIAHFPDGHVIRTLLGQGVYVLELADMADGQVDPASRTTFAFRDQAATLPVPVAGEYREFETVVSDGVGPYAETILLRWAGVTDITYGDCTYRMIPGTFEHQSADYWHREVVYYLPALGFGILHSYFDNDMSEPAIYPVADIAKG